MLKKSVLLLLFTLTAYAQKDAFGFPAYKSVVRHFLETYTIDTLYSQNDIRFEKRPDGYALTILATGRDEVDKTMRFWDRKKQDYIALDLEPRGNYAFSDVIFQTLTRNINELFDKTLYYNYPGWERETIAALERVAHPDDAQLYALGYAYSNLSGNMLSDNSGLSEKDVRFVLPKGPDALTPAQLAQYRAVKHKAIKTFAALLRQNPGYKVTVGQIGMKYANEITSAYLDLLTFQNEAEALKELDGPVAYSEGVMDYARNMLGSCAPDAILFTYGDNDTFPLLYCQAKLGFRTDVLVLNTSLLQADSYIMAMRNRVHGIAGMPYTLPEAFLYDALSETVVLRDEGDSQAMAIPELMRYVQDPAHILEGTSRNYPSYPSNVLSMGSGLQRMEWQFDVPALYRYQLVILDILAANDWKRPVYFGSNMGDDSYLGLADYLQFQGLVCRLSPKKGKADEQGPGHIDPDVLATHLEKLYRFPSGHALPAEEQQFCYDYRVMHSRLAQYYFDNGQNDKAEACMDSCIRKMDNAVSVYGYDVVPIISIYYDLKAFDKGKAIAKQLLYNIDHGIHKYLVMNEEDLREVFGMIKEDLEKLNDFYKVRM